MKPTCLVCAILMAIIALASLPANAIAGRLAKGSVTRGATLSCARGWLTVHFVASEPEAIVRLTRSNVGENLWGARINSATVVTRATFENYAVPDTAIIDFQPYVDLYLNPESVPEEEIIFDSSSPAYLFDESRTEWNFWESGRLGTLVSLHLEGLIPGVEYSVNVGWFGPCGTFDLVAITAEVLDDPARDAWIVANPVSFQTPGVFTGSAVALGDIDSDGYPDVVSGSLAGEVFARKYESWIFWALGGYDAEPIQGGLDTRGVALADADNDGDLDAAAIRWGAPNDLYRLDGADFSGFMLSTASAPALASAGSGPGVSWCDYDRDGLVDLFVLDRQGANHTLLHNDGSLAFSDATPVAFQALVDAWSAAWGDYDGDRLSDLYISSATTSNALYKNLGDGTFVDVAAELGVEGSGPSRGAAWLDYDNDGDLDLHVATHGGPDQLFRNDGGTHFVDMAAQVGLAHGGDTQMGAWADVDNDGDLDVYLSIWGEPNRMLTQNPSGFVDSTPDTLGLMDTTGAAWADVAGDGYLDLVVPGAETDDRLFVNLGFGNPFVVLRLEGVTSNRSAIGAEVRVRTDDGQVMTRVIDGGSGLGSQNELRAFFGLGDRNILSVDIRWPNGHWQTMTNVQPGFVTIVEPTVTATQPGREGRSWIAMRGNPFSPGSEILFVLAQAERVQLTIYDLRGRRVRRIVEGQLEAGSHRRAWDGRDDRGAPVAAGAYTVVLRAGPTRDTRKLVLIR